MAYADEVLADSPRVYYKMDESSGQPQDSSGNGNHTTVTAGTPDYSQAGQVGTSIRLASASTERFTAPDHSSIDLGDTFTMECWCKRAGGLGTGQTLIVRGNSSFQMFFSTGNAVALAKHGVAIVVTATTTITDTTAFHHIVITKTGSTVFIYIDGVDVTGTVTNQTMTDGSDALSIGSNTNGTSEWLDAYIDEIAIYPTALSQSRVLAHYNAGFEPTPTWTSLPRRGVAGVA